MKSVSSPLRTHLAGAVTTLAACWQMVRVDGTVFAFTAHDADLVIGGVTYQSTVGFDTTAVVTTSAGQVDNLEVLGFLADDGITARDINNGLFNFSSVYLFVVNWVDLTQGICRLRRGWIGEITRMPNGAFHAELRGLVQALVQEFGNVYTPFCRADLGDTKCQVDILSATYRRTGTVASATTAHAFVAEPLVYPAGLMGNTAQISIRNNVSAGTAMSVSDGVNVAAMIWLFDTAGITAFSDINSQIIAAGLNVTLSSPASLVIDIVSNTGVQGNIIKTGDVANPTALLIQNFTDGYLDGGTVTWITGNNAGSTIELKTYDPDTSTVTLWLGAGYPIQAGDTFYYYPGCDKRRDTCARKYNNIVNFRGEPDMPGVDQMISYPDA